MDKPKTIEYQGEQYFDDRLFILYLCKGAIKIEEGDDGAVWTTIYHENPPENHVWCVVTYKNYNRYPLYKIDSFHKKEDADDYIKKIEPMTPLISLGGVSPEKPLTFEKYCAWKKENNLKDYDWKSLYLPGGSNAEECIGQTKDQFGGIK